MLVPGSSASSSATRVLHSLAARRKQELVGENTAADDLTRKVLKAAVFGATTPSPADGYHSSYADQGFKPTPARGRPLNGVVTLDQHRLRKQLEGRQRQSRNTKTSREGLVRGPSTPSGARGFASAASLAHPPLRAEHEVQAPARPSENEKGKGREKKPVPKNREGVSKTLDEARQIELGSFVEIRKCVQVPSVSQTSP